MSFRFFRRMRIAPGVTINLSKTGASLSLGPRGAKVTVGTHGVRTTLGLPGSGAYWTKHFGYGEDDPPSATSETTAVAERPEDRLSLGFFDRIMTPKREENFVDGMRQFVQGHEAAALQRFEKATDLADAAFMAAILALKQERFVDAKRFLADASQNQDRLGQRFEEYGIQATVSLEITEEFAAIIKPDARGLLFVSAEVHQHQDQPKDAIADLQRLHEKDPDDVVVRLSLAELLVEEVGGQEDCESVVRLAEGIENDSEIHAALLLYKAKALRGLGLLTAARETLSATMRRKKGRSDELLRSLRYERSLVYEDLGQDKRARKEWERLYADSPDFEDVAARLGLA